MTRRPGLSLTEVLVALFIMGIGCIAILTLFPLGALNMAQAFRDDRCTQSASQADAFLRYYVKDKAGRGQLRTPPPNGEGFIEALDNPNYNPDPKKAVSLPPILAVGTPPPASYPVVIDPLGYLARGGTDDYPSNWDKSVCWVGDNGIASSGLARRSLRSINRYTSVPPYTAGDRAKQQPLAIRCTTLLDGFGYDPNSGSPATIATGGAVDRDLRYNWLWVIQRLADGKVLMTVVVFDKRSPTYVPPDAETAWIPSVAAVGQRQLQFLSGSNGSKLPPVQKGGWLLDATTISIVRTGMGGATKEQPKFTTPTAGAAAWVRNATFYRVAGTSEDATRSTLDVELDTPLRPDTADFLPGDPTVDPPDRRFIYLSGVAEVFERDRELVLTP